MFKALPAQVVLLARTARNRALFALPPAPGAGRGRRRKYGAQGPTPAAQLADRRDWQHTTVPIRRRRIPLTYKVTGPWLVKLAANQPVFLLVVKGVGDGYRHRRRLPTFLLVTAQQRGTQWVLPLTAPRLLAWAWQRWEVEVMHRELKQGLGFGQQQAWTPVSAQTAPAWVAWTYALLVLSGYRTWGWTTSPARARWQTPGSRWTVRDVRTAIRETSWQDLGPPFRALLPGIGTNWLENPSPPGSLDQLVTAATYSRPQ